MSKESLLRMDDFERGFVENAGTKIVVKAGKILDECEDKASQIARGMVIGLRMDWDNSQNIGSPSNPQQGQFWHNRTYKAVTHMFFESYHVGHNVGFYGFYSENLGYAEALEGRFGALASMMSSYSRQFLIEIKELYKG